MPDPRVEQYARLLVERCLNVQPGWQVVVQSSPLARPLVEEVLRHIERIAPGNVREKATFVTKMEEAMFWANAAIARPQEERG